MKTTLIYYIKKAMYKLIDGVLIGFGIHIAWYLIG